MAGKFARKIIHVDMDAFYASVEQRDNPAYKTKPVIVGGPVSRGVVSACSYEARAFGVHSAMPMAKAMRLCPGAIVLPVRMTRYAEISRHIFQIFSSYTDQVEPLSIDEAFLDVTGCEKLFGDARDIAEQIRERIARECGLPASAGVAGNKFLAKLASEEAKPNGLLEIHPDEVDRFLLPLPVNRIWGVGPSGAERLEQSGVKTINELRSLTRETLTKMFGVLGERLYFLARGKDDRKVESAGSLKSIGNEETFAKDIWDREELRTHLLALAEKVAWRLRQTGVKAGNLTLKIRYGDFVLHTHSKKFTEPTDSLKPIMTTAEELLEKTEVGRKGIRLLGINTAHLSGKEEGQLSLFVSKDDMRHKALDQAVDALHERFGQQSVKRGSLVVIKEGESDNSD